MRILFLSPWFPYPPVNGSKTRIFNLLKHLAVDYEIDLIACIREGESFHAEGLAGICVSIQTLPWKEFNPQGIRASAGYFSRYPRSVFETYNPDLDRLVQKVVRETQPGLIIASELACARYAQGAIHTPVIIEDIEFAGIYEAWQNESDPIARLRKWLTWQKTKRYIKHIVSSSSLTTVVSNDEQHRIQESAGAGEKVHIIPNGVDLEYWQKETHPPKQMTLIYPGALTFHSNYDAMQYYFTAIYPRIVKRLPDVRMFVTGDHTGVDLDGLNLPTSVTLTGFLQDIRPAISSAWACVVPLRTGSGTRIKILECLAAGTPVITTPKGMQGLDLKPGEHILVAQDPADFAEKTRDLLLNPELREKLSHAGQKRVEELYNWDNIGSNFRQMVKAVLIRSDKHAMDQ